MIYQFPDCARRYNRRNRATKFIGEHFQSLAGFPRRAHLLVESTVARWRSAAVERGANNGVAWIRQHNSLRGDFGFSIDAQRADGIRFDVVPLAAIEYEIAGEKDEGDFFGKFRQRSRCFHVDAAGQLRIGLAIRAAAHRGAVNDQSGPLFRESTANGVGVEQVESCARQTLCRPLGRESRRSLDEVIADEAARACNPSRCFGK